GAILADLDNHRVIRFAPDGRARPVLGREGAGPGELLAIGNLVAMPNGEIVVADVRKAALVRWDAEGKVLPEVRVRPFMLAVHRVGAQLLIKSHDWRTDTLRLYRVDLQGGAPLLSAASFLAPTNPGSVTRVTTPLAAWTTTTAGRILVGHPDSLYLVSELDLRGTLLRQWSRPGYAVARWTEEELDRLEGFAAMATREGGSRARPSRAEFTHRSTIGQ